MLWQPEVYFRLPREHTAYTAARQQALNFKPVAMDLGLSQQNSKNFELYKDLYQRRTDSRVLVANVA